MYVYSILFDNVFLIVSVLILIVIGIEIVFIKRLIIVKLVIRMFEFVCNFLIFMIVIIINIFKYMVGGFVVIVIVIVSWREMFLCEFWKNGDMFRLKFDNLEELFMEFFVVFMFVIGM